MADRGYHPFCDGLNRALGLPGGRGSLSSRSVRFQARQAAARLGVTLGPDLSVFADQSWYPDVPGEDLERLFAIVGALKEKTIRTALLEGRLARPLAALVGEACLDRLWESLPADDHCGSAPTVTLAELIQCGRNVCAEQGDAQPESLSDHRGHKDQAPMPDMLRQALALLRDNGSDQEDR